MIDVKIIKWADIGLCPCFGKCCDKTEAFNPEHKCVENCVCDDCFILECKNCGKCCGHEI
jgi:hypothetical protein